MFHSTLLLTVGEVYAFHMSAAVVHLEEDDYQVIGEYVETVELENATYLLVKGEETGKRIALNAFYTCLIEPVDDEDETEETDADGVRILRAEGVEA